MDNLLLSIIVPTFNEGDNVRRVVHEVAFALPDTFYEIVFVDDSVDDTPDILQQLSVEYANVRYIHRTQERGLGTAVVRGFELATGRYVAVMDADLQHPPAVLRDMLITMETGMAAGADIVIPSRFVPGGSDGGLAPHRKVVSFVARLMGQVALKRLRHITDPTSGFFMMKRSVVQGVALQPIGWKILIEVLARGHYDRVLEIPYAFQAREAGISKMSLREQGNYILHLVKLVKESPSDRRLFLFLLVGASGVVINMALYDWFVHLTMPVPTAGTLSALFAMCSNFLLNDRVTWRDHSSPQSSVLTRAAKYILTSLVGIGVNVGVLYVLNHQGHMDYLLANLLGIIVATLWNYAINNSWTWRVKSGSVIADKALVQHVDRMS